MAEEKEITLKLKPSEVFQLHLSVLNRIGNVQIKFSNAYCEEEQKSTESLLYYLTQLDQKISEVLRNEK